MSSNGGAICLLRNKLLAFEMMMMFSSFSPLVIKGSSGKFQNSLITVRQTYQNAHLISERENLIFYIIVISSNQIKCQGTICGFWKAKFRRLWF